MNDKAQTFQSSGRKSILELTHDEARAFLLKPDSYFSQEMPPYIVFKDLIDGVHQVLDGRTLQELINARQLRDRDRVNYTILHNKDGRYSWRPFQLIHPALYVSLVHALTESNNWRLIGERFRGFASNKKLNCMSLPVQSATDQKDRAEQVTEWWQAVEQHSIELSLDYEYLIQTDITDCYGAIYTHSIAWALHTKREAKSKENRSNRELIGNIIDSCIQDMRNGQTNGIPQGSVIMDFIAEMVLGYADQELSARLENEGSIKDYYILRYRDDYRVFVNSPQVGEAIIKLIAETTTELGLKLNTQKTKANSDVLRASIKSDKLAWMARKQADRRLQNHLLIIHNHATEFPNSGSLARALNEFYKRVSRVKSISESPKPLIAIVADIAFSHPRTYAICSAILSRLLSFIETDEEKLYIVKRIRQKFAQIPNTGIMQIWLQRVTFSLDRSIDYDETICKLVAESTSTLWNNEWISSRELKEAVNATRIVDATIRDNIAPVIPFQEVELFLSQAGNGFYG